MDAWVFRAASEHPFEVAGSEPSCATHDPELFWPATAADAEQARAVCRGCPLAQVCLTHRTVTTSGHQARLTRG